MRDSVFKDWKIPTDGLIEKSLKIDFEYSKLFRLLKQDKDKEEVFKVLKIYAGKIIDTFTYQISKSTFPSISWLDFSNWVNKVKTYDHNCKVTDVDRIFIQTNVELIEQEDNPDGDLCRYEFYEILVRIAACKFYDSKICATYADATRKYIEEHVLMYTDENAYKNQWFGDGFLWNKKVDDLYGANLEIMKKLYKSRLVHG